MKTAKLSIRQTTVKSKNRSGVYWCVTSPKMGGGSVRKHFLSEQEARTYYEQQEVQQKNYGTAALSFSDKLRVDAQAAETILGPEHTLREAARFFKDYMNKLKAGIPLSAAVSAFLEQKAAGGASIRHQHGLRLRLATFVGAMPKDSTTAKITASDVDKFLSGVKGGPQTRMHYRAVLHSLFKWCKKHKHCSENPVADAMTFKVVPSAPGILTPEEAANLLANCSDDIRAGVVIGMFCGLRQAEIARLDWRHVDVVGGSIDGQPHIKPFHQLSLPTTHAFVTSPLQSACAQTQPWGISGAGGNPVETSRIPRRQSCP